jgi:undecaprenyl pyrophosphate synthase
MIYDTKNLEITEYQSNVLLKLIEQELNRIHEVRKLHSKNYTVEIEGDDKILKMKGASTIEWLKLSRIQRQVFIISAAFDEDNNPHEKI